MLSKSVSSLVVDDKGKPVGVIGESDIIGAVVSKKAKIKAPMYYASLIKMDGRKRIVSMWVTHCSRAETTRPSWESSR